MFKQKGGDQISENTDNIARIQVQLDSLKQVVDNFLKGESKTVTQEQPESAAPPTTVTQKQPESVASPTTTVTQEQASGITTQATEMTDCEIYNKCVNTNCKKKPEQESKLANKICEKLNGRRYIDLERDSIDCNGNPGVVVNKMKQAMGRYNASIPEQQNQYTKELVNDVFNGLGCGTKLAGGKKKTNKRNKKVLKRTNKKIGGNCQNLALVNNKLNIYAQPQISQGTTRSFTGNYKINGPLPRGSLVPRAIEQVNLRKNVLPGGKKSKKKRVVRKRTSNRKK